MKERVSAMETQPARFHYRLGANQPAASPTARRLAEMAEAIGRETDGAFGAVARFEKILGHGLSPSAPAKDCWFERRNGMPDSFAHWSGLMFSRLTPTLRKSSHILMSFGRAHMPWPAPDYFVAISLARDSSIS
jgi:hypothetical protein